MRLYNIYYICKENIDLIRKLEFSNYSNTADKVVFDNWIEISGILNKLYMVDGLKEAVAGVHNCLDAIVRDTAQPIISSGTKNDIIQKNNILVSKMNTIIEVYEAMGNYVSGVGIDVKIPKCSDLKEYINYLKDIDFIFTQCPFLLVENETIKFNNVDIGSIWLTFIVFAETGNRILNNVAKLINKAISVKSNILVYKQQEEQLQAMKQKNEVGEETVNAFKKLKDLVLQDAVTSLEKDINELNDGEERGKTAVCIERLIMLIDKGVEIYSSIETPAEIKVLFPVKEGKTLLSDDVTKLLEEKNK